MGRRPRILLVGGLYHVNNRVSRGEYIFRDEREADRFGALVAAIKKRGDLQILAPMFTNQQVCTWHPCSPPQINKCVRGTHPRGQGCARRAPRAHPCLPSRAAVP